MVRGRMAQHRNAKVQRQMTETMGEWLERERGIKIHDDGTVSATDGSWIMPASPGLREGEDDA